MGQRHVDYGAQEEHYNWVGASLLKTFSFFFKEAWTKELQEQWAMAFGAIKSMMMEGQKSVAPEAHDLRARAEDICNSLLMQILDEELDDKVVEKIRAKVRKTIMTCMNDECSKLLKKAV